MRYLLMLGVLLCCSVAVASPEDDARLKKQLQYETQWVEKANRVARIEAAKKNLPVIKGWEVVKKTQKGGRVTYTHGPKTWPNPTYRKPSKSPQSKGK